MGFEGTSQSTYAVLYTYLIRLSTMEKLMHNIRACLKNSGWTVKVEQKVSGALTIISYQKQGVALSLLLFNTTLEKAEQKVTTDMLVFGQSRP